MFIPAGPSKSSHRYSGVPAASTWYTYSLPTVDVVGAKETIFTGSSFSRSGGGGSFVEQPILVKSMLNMANSEIMGKKCIVFILRRIKTW